jgi:hypothetical protein
VRAWEWNLLALTEKKMERILLVGSNPVFILFIYFQKWNSFILLREILWIFLLFFSLNLICVFIFIII